VIRDASSAGAAAASAERGTPIAKAIAASLQVSAGGAAADATYSVLTVVEVRETAPQESPHPARMPTRDPVTPRTTASARNMSTMRPLVLPSARSIPISLRRATTEIETVL
jgi:hypothetical protein